MAPRGRPESARRSGTGRKASTPPRAAPTTSRAGAVHLTAESPWRWRIEPVGAMRVPGVVFASERLLPDVVADRSLDQVAGVATLPGIVRASYAMPDVHWGYGFPIGGVAATDVAEGGVVSPGGVGFDISCGVRLLTTPFTVRELGARLGDVMDRLGRTIPRGMGRGGLWEVDEDSLRALLVEGTPLAVRRGHGRPLDVERCEDGGVLAGADPDAVSHRAVERGLHQIGSLGSGNHFLEVQAVDRVLDGATAAAWGVETDQVCVMIHSGSRGLGHQVCSDHVRVMQDAMSRHGISVPDPQLACVPVDSDEGRSYLGAMAAAANYGRVNRQLLAEGVRAAFGTVTGRTDLELLYDVSHNLAKLESHLVDGHERSLCVHRKGATRALPPGHVELPAGLRATGQPVLVPGSMGTASWLLCGRAPGDAFHSTCHGAGRTMSRHEATRRIGGRQLRQELEAAGVIVRPGSWKGLAEEAPFAYKDVDEVVAVVEAAGLSHRVARLRPLGVVKG